MKPFSVLNALALAGYAMGVPADTPVSSTITINDGTIQGNPRDASGVLSFKGIPFAKPPIDELRWKPPKPAAQWHDVLDATTFGATCWGAPGLNSLGSTGPVNQSEDCLTINVWTPANTTKQNLPVMVWIYGGGFQYGSSSRPEWDGSTLATKDVIVVSFNYRVSTLGFLALPELDSPGSPSGNFGLEDMILALKWVQSNINAFGGDPDKVTVWGESAGSHAVGLLLSSPLAKGLFGGAICESGAFWDYEYGSLQTFVQARMQGKELQAALGANSARELRYVSPEKLVSALPYKPRSPKPILFGPSIDYHVLPSPPAEVFATERQANVPLLAGFNEKEALIFSAESFPHDTPQHFENAARLWFGDESLSSFSSAYPDSVKPLNSSAAKLLGDMTIREQTWEAAAAQSRINSNVYLYYYTYASPYSPLPIHTAEIPFVFGTLTPSPLSPVPAGADDKKFSEILQTYWSNFAKYRDPNGPQGELPDWPKYTGCEDNFQQLNQKIAPTEYSLKGFQFLKGFRRNGLFPLKWHSLDVSKVPE